MKRLSISAFQLFGLLLFVGVVLAGCSASTQLTDPTIPTITKADRGWVDTTNSVPSNTMEALRKQSDRIGQEGFQLAGVFFKDIISDPAQFATKVANENGIGSKEKDNGILIMVLLDRAGTDGHKPYIFVAIGSGLEGLLNDAKVTRFREQYFNPKRAEGKWQEGLVQLATAFGDYLGSSEAKEFSNNPNDSQSVPTIVWLVIGGSIGFILLIAFVLWAVWNFFLRDRSEPSEEPETYPDPEPAPVEELPTAAFYDPPVPVTRHTRRRRASAMDASYLSTPVPQEDAEERRREREEEEEACRRRRREEEEEEEEEEARRRRQDDDSSFGSSSSLGGFGGGSFGGGGSFSGGGSGG